ncbi:erg26, C-3 sterol dehydrogenase [Marasmius tenuissimus]|uniref:Erg26, C-3 sterol dehydrogenase n=1 Tax=Marasmius tenuissimus TaxID=585030 RepID=A0ABR2ZSI3_9AGAR
MPVLWVHDVTPPPNAEQLSKTFQSPEETSNRPVTRTRFDYMSEYSRPVKTKQPEEMHPLQVAGQAFFITNGEPCYFWDMPRCIWRKLDAMFPGHLTSRRRIVLRRPSVGLAVAWASESVGMGSGERARAHQVQSYLQLCQQMAQHREGPPGVGDTTKLGFEEGVDLMFEWWRSEYVGGGHTRPYTEDCFCWIIYDTIYVAGTINAYLMIF